MPGICSVEVNESGMPVVKMPDGTPIKYRPKGTPIIIEHVDGLARVTLTLFCNIKPTNHE